MALEHHYEQGIMSIATYQSGGISIPWQHYE